MRTGTPESGTSSGISVVVTSGSGIETLPVERVAVTVDPALTTTLSEAVSLAALMSLLDVVPPTASVLVAAVSTPSATTVMLRADPAAIVPKEQPTKPSTTSQPPPGEFTDSTSKPAGKVK